MTTPSDNRDETGPGSPSATEATGEYFGKDLEAMSFARNYHAWILAELRPYLGHAVAEVGAGMGNVSALLLDEAIHSLDAFEPSNNMFPVLAQRIGSDSRTRVINDLFRRETIHRRYDAVVYINVLEHIADDLGELETARDALAADGHLLVFVPALPWLYSELDRQVGHVQRYTRTGLTDVVGRAGFRIVRLRYFDIAGILPWYVNFKLLGRPINAGSVSLYDRLVVPVMRSMEKVLVPPVGKNLLLVAQPR